MRDVHGGVGDEEIVRLVAEEGGAKRVREGSVYVVLVRGGAVESGQDLLVLRVNAIHATPPAGRSG